jgi:hypothetical protein
MVKMAEPIPCKDCKKKDTGSQSERCPRCKKKHTIKQRARWNKKVASGNCPRCGVRPKIEGAKSCVECGLGVGDDYVEAAFGAATWDPLRGRWRGLKRLTKKWLGDR